MPLLDYPKTKTGNDIQVYYNLGIGRIYKNLVYTGHSPHGVTEAPVVCCVDQRFTESCECPDPPGPLDKVTIIMAKNRGVVGTLPKYSPLHTATLGEHPPTALGDIVAYACLPDPEDDKLICFDQGISVSPGVSTRAIPVKYNAADHHVRQRPENTITLNDLFVSNWEGVQRIRGIPCTIIIKIGVEGANVYTEIQYYSNVVLNPSPMNSGSDGNASIDISMEGNFAFSAIFSGSSSNFP